MAPERWESKRVRASNPWPMPSIGVALARGLMCRCPSCGRAPLFAGYLRVARDCTSCGAPLGSARADDAPPYFTIVIVGHIVVPLMLLMQRAQDPSSLTLTAIFVPLTIVLVLTLLRPIKGATVGAMLCFNLVKPDEEMPPVEMSPVEMSPGDMSAMPIPVATPRPPRGAGLQ